MGKKKPPRGWVVDIFLQCLTLVASPTYKLWVNDFTNIVESKWERWVCVLRNPEQEMKPGDLPSSSSHSAGSRERGNEEIQRFYLQLHEVTHQISRYILCFSIHMASKLSAIFSCVCPWTETAPSFGQKCPDQVSCMISDYVMVFCLSNPVQHLLLVRSNHLPAAAESVCHPLTWEHLMNVYMVRPISRFPDHVSHPLPSHFSHFSWGYKFTKTQVCTWFKNNQKWMDCLVSLRKPLAMAVATVMDFYSALQPCWAWFPSAIVILGLYTEFEW